MDNLQPNLTGGLPPGMSGGIADSDALRSRTEELRDQVLSLRAQIDAAGTVGETDTLADVCALLWQQVKAVDILLHELLIHNRPGGNMLSPHPTDSILACVTGALSQVEGVMSSEHAADIVKGRLHMASALTRHALDAIEAELDRMADDPADAQGRLTGDRSW